MPNFTAPHQLLAVVFFAKTLRAIFQLDLSSSVRLPVDVGKRELAFLCAALCLLSSCPHGQVLHRRHVLEQAPFDQRRSHEESQDWHVDGVANQ